VERLDLYSTGGEDAGGERNGVDASAVQQMGRRGAPRPEREGLGITRKGTRGGRGSVQRLRLGLGWSRTAENSGFGVRTKALEGETEGNG